MERWARWSAGREGDTSLGWPRITIIGTLIRDMPTTKCFTCNGDGRVPGWKVGSTLAFLTCPTCSGKGKIDADPNIRGPVTTPCIYCKSPDTGKSMGETEGKTCIHCRGSSMMPMPANYDGRTPGSAVNPAFLRSTKMGGYVENDPISQRIDFLICTAITEDERVVIMHEYRWSRTRQQALARLHVSSQYFTETLADALRSIEQNL